MTKDCDTQYKISRNSAGFTQEQAAEMLAEEINRPLAVRTLSNYENGHDRVSHSKHIKIVLPTSHRDKA